MISSPLTVKIVILSFTCEDIDVVVVNRISVNHLDKNIKICQDGRHDFQPFCAPAFLCANHGWITGLPQRGREGVGGGGELANLFVPTSLAIVTSRT